MKPGIDYTGISVVFYCHDGEGNFVMDLRGKNCRDEQGRWEIGAGKLRYGEDPIDALKREVEEEYCATPIEIEFLGIRSAVREHEGAKTHWIMLDFKVLVDKDQVANGEPEKLDAVEWITRETAPEPVHSQFPIFVEKYRDKL